MKIVVFTTWKTDKPLTKIKSCKLCNKKWNKEQTIKQHTITESHLKSKLKVIDNDKVKEGDKFFKKGQSILNKDFKLAITCLWEGVKRYQQSQSSGSLFNGLFHLIELLTENRKKELITMSISQMNQMLFICYRSLFNLIYYWDLELGLRISALALENKFGIKLMEYSVSKRVHLYLRNK
ncbi:hypothetical protein K502DRAFT_105984 [Neoconidiobolus thromboides FSU 785]|nr:hypothetical protein K502DRAFT_105984 [Neoconidiobolus thromboides FSU 785]